MTAETRLNQQLGVIHSAGVADALPGHYFKRQAGFPYWTLGSSRSGERYTTPLSYAGTPGDPGRRVYRGPHTISLTRPLTEYATHSERGLKDSVFVIFTAGPALLSLLDWKQDAPGMSSCQTRDMQEHNTIIDAMIATIRWHGSHHPYRNELAINALYHVLLLVAPIALAHDSKAGRRQPTDIRVTRVLSAIHADPARHWSIAELAEVACASESSLAHLFKQQTGQTPMRYAEACRIGRAREILLYSNDTIAQIADRLGYANAFHFSARFRALTGQSPRGYRQKPQDPKSTQRV